MEHIFSVCTFTFINLHFFINKIIYLHIIYIKLVFIFYSMKPNNLKINRFEAHCFGFIYMTDD